MIKQIKMVEDFHIKLDYFVREKPTITVPDEVEERFKLMNEEVNEYRDAGHNENMVGIADAIGDILYTVFGTIVQHGLQDIIEEVFDEIHRSNMSKSPSPGGVGKAIKGDNFSPANLSTWFTEDHPHE